MSETFKLPIPTWSWLGVNETKFPAQPPQNETLAIDAGANERRQSVLINRGDSAQNIKAHVQKGAELSLIVLNLNNAALANSIAAEVDDGGKIEVILAETGKFLATDLNINLVGDNAKGDVYSLYFGKEDDCPDLNYRIILKGKNTSANMTVKGALTGRADKIFRGTLDFLQGAKNSVGKESEEVIVFSDTVRNRSVPLMLSQEDDVDGHHGVSIGKIDEDKLFYLTSRGLDEDEASRLVFEGVASPVLSRLKDNAALIKDVRAALGLPEEEESDHE